jgi:hypothetical protein
MRTDQFELASYGSSMAKGDKQTPRRWNRIARRNLGPVGVTREHGRFLAQLATVGSPSRGAMTLVVAPVSTSRAGEPHAFEITPFAAIASAGGWKCSSVAW